MAHWPVRLLLISLLFMTLTVKSNAQENNNELLKDALEMIYRRQNNIGNVDNPDETVFLKPQHSNPIPFIDMNDERNDGLINDFEQYPRSLDSGLSAFGAGGGGGAEEELTLPYEVFYNENIPEDDKPISKRKHSVFRERVDHPQNTGEIMYPKFTDVQTDDLENELDYANLLQEYWQRYLAQRQHNNRQRLQLDEMPKNSHSVLHNKRTQNHNLRLPYFHSDNIVMKKRFPVSKRSSSITPKPVKKTDPKVERDLSNIFGNKQDSLKKTKTPKKVHANLNNKKNHTKTEPKIKPDNFNVKKKSIDWSNYFGIDKRNKKSTVTSHPNQEQSDWMIEQYKNTFKKINNLDNEDNDETREQKQRRDDTKLDVIKDKLRNIEDMIIDEALKYTGAHEGADVDSKEIQEVKDKVMSRLAAVYSLEKMRRALGEFKKSIAEQRQTLKANQLNGEFDVMETVDDPPTDESHYRNHNHHDSTTKTTASNEQVNRIPNKKDSLLHLNQNNDNNIVNQQSDDHAEDCDILEVIQRQCSHLATKAGEQLVQPLCMLHQLCTLCGIDESNDNQQNIIENSDLGCYYMYAAESEHACAGETQCRRRANYALNTLRDSHTHPIFTSDMCPHNTICVENVLETAKRRLSFSPYIMSRHNI